MSSLSRLVHGFPLPADRYTDLPGDHMLSTSGSIRPRTPGSTRANRHSATRIVACRRGQTRRHSRRKLFGVQHLQGRLHPLPLHLAFFRAYASTRLLPVAPQGSIPGSWLAITQAGVPPARPRGLARPHCPRLPSDEINADVLHRRGEYCLTDLPLIRLYARCPAHQRYPTRAGNPWCRPGTQGREQDGCARFWFHRRADHNSFVPKTAGSHWS